MGHNSYPAAGLWSYVRERRERRQRHISTRRDVTQGVIALVAAVAAGSAMLAPGHDWRSVYELAGRFTVGAAVYLALVYGVKAAFPRVWNPDAPAKRS